jgi:pimeloyl-ACP methyl ester carboxylesterase
MEEPAASWARQLQDYAAFAAIVYRGGASKCIPTPEGWSRSTDPADTVDNHTGLYFEVWEHAHETAIVFRGTQALEWRDWWSNARWLTRFLPIGLDQYTFVAQCIAEVVSRARGRRPGVAIVAVGHSLGGGLAQHAAYAHPDIKRVVAFDPSPVTGFRSVSRPARDRNRIGVHIERVYEAGEILAFVRGAIRGLLSLSTADPDIVEVRFNFRGFGLITQHSMERLALDLRDAATRDDSARPVSRDRVA